MPYPALIPPTPEGWDLGFSPHGVQGIEYLGDQYIFVIQGAELGVGDEKMHVLKSADLGLTWTDTDSVTWPSFDPAFAPVLAYTNCQDGNLVYVLGTATEGSSGADNFCGPLYLAIYDLTSNLFTTVPTAVASAPVIPKFWTGSAHLLTAHANINLILRSPGSFYFIYPGPPETVGGLQYARVYITTFNGSTFGAGVFFGGQALEPRPFSQAGVNFDQTGILHMTLASLNKKYYHVSMNAAGNAFGSLQIVEPSAFNISTTGGDMSTILPFTNVSTDSIAFVGVQNDFGDGLVTFYYAASGVLDPVWASQGIVSSVPPVPGTAANGNELMVALHLISGVLVVFWTSSGHSPNWRVADGEGRVELSHSTTADVTTWTANLDLFVATDQAFHAVSLLTWNGSSIGVGVVGNFVEEIHFGELSNFAVFGPLALHYDNAPGVVGTPYSDSLVAIGGTPPYVLYEIISGSLPPGLILTGALISGTPTNAGVFPFTAQVTDSLGGVATVDASITITAFSIFGTVTIQLIGWKLYVDRPCDSFEPVKEIPKPDWWK